MVRLPAPKCEPQTQRKEKNKNKMLFKLKINYMRNKSQEILAYG